MYPPVKEQCLEIMWVLNYWNNNVVSIQAALRKWEIRVLPSTSDPNISSSSLNVFNNNAENQIVEQSYSVVKCMLSESS